MNMINFPSAKPVKANRRDFLKGGVAGLVIAFTFTPRKLLAADAAAPAKKPVDPNAFVHIAPDSTVTVLIKHLEMGQGVYTGLPTVVAEELDADWSQMRAAHAPADVAKYANLAFGMQGTGGSTALSNSYDQLRQAGAMARAMLVQAAAQAWKVPAAEITVKKGVIAHAASKHTGTFGDFAVAAAKITPPTDVKLKDPKDFTLIGTEIPRLDNVAKTTGTAIYTIDVQRPGMVYAVVARPKRFGGVVKSVDQTKASAIPGVKQIMRIPSGVAVVADSLWTAMKARDALKIEWDDTKAEKRGSAQLWAEYKELAKKPGEVARNDGDAAGALAKAKQVVSAEFEFPFLAHAPMEPLDCVMEAKDGKVEIWAGSQFQTLDHMNAAKVFGVTPDKVTLNTLVSGGSFGRRATPVSDYIVETAEITKAMPAGTPVKLVWTREDDIRGGRYRPMYFHSVKAALNEKGELTAWQHRIVGQSITKGSPFESPGLDGMIVEGAKNLPYTVPNFAMDAHTTNVGVPAHWWRSVGSTHNAYATEAFFDIIAKAAGKEPLEFRRALLGDNKRHRGVLDLAAEKAGWGSKMPANSARGIAVAEAFGTVVAQVAEVSRKPNGGFKVDRIVCAVDCGVAVNPDVIRAQMEGGIGYGLGAILHSQVTLTNGVVDQGNFDAYKSLRIDEMPKIEVYIVPSTNAPTGVGEPGVPPAGPAVANAILALTGKPVTKLPMLQGSSV